MTRRSRLDTYEAPWWQALRDWRTKHNVVLSDEADEDLFLVVCDAIDHEAARTLGVAGGQRGGLARAARMTPEQRRASAVNAARARWGDRK